MKLDVVAHFDAQLDAIRDDLVETDDVQAATLHLIAFLKGAILTAATRDDLLLQLVNDAARLLNECDSVGWNNDRRDWLRAAAPFVRS